MAYLLARKGRSGPDGVYRDPAAYFPKLSLVVAEPCIRAVLLLLISLCPFCFFCAYSKGFPEYWALSRSLLPSSFFDKGGFFLTDWFSILHQVSHPIRLGVGIACISLLLCGWYSAVRYIAQGYHLPAKLKHSCQPPSWMKGKIAVVTGGNAGIGLETTKQLARWGTHVLIGCRRVDEASHFAQQFLAVSTRRSNKDAAASACTKKKNGAPTRSTSAGEEAHSASGSIRVHYLDLLDLESVQAFAKWALAQTGGKIDFLVNNAGIMSTEKLTVDAKTGFEKHFVTNHLGPFLLTQLLLPAVKQANGRIVNVSSIAHVTHGPKVRPLDYAVSLETATAIASKLKQPLSQLQGEPISLQNYGSRRVYGETKLFNIWFTKALQRRLTADKETKATAYAAHPGLVDTNLLLHYSQGTNRWLTRFTAIIHKLIAPLFLKTPAQGAATQLMLCVTDQRKLKAGAFYIDGTNSWVDPIALDEVRQEELWEISMLLCQPYLSGDASSLTPEGQKVKIKGKDA